MAFTPTMLSGSAQHAKYKCVNTNPSTGGNISNATILTGLTVGTPLYDAWNTTYATQAAARTALMDGLCTVRGWYQLGDVSQDLCVDVELTGGAGTAPRVVCLLSNVGSTFLVELEYYHSIAR